MNLRDKYNHSIQGKNFRMDGSAQERGNANEYMRIFEANRDQLSDPDVIKPGQVLRIPAMDRQLT